MAASKEVDNDSNGAIDIQFGGTNATTQGGARVNLGLGSVDNTSDADKPVSTATQVEIDSQKSSSEIDYDQGGTGSAVRTVENKLQESVSIRDYPVVGDGIADDYTALNNAMDDATANDKKLFGVKGDIYKILTPLVVSGVVDFDFNGATIDASALATATSLDEIVALDVAGSIEASMAVTGSVAIGQNLITIADTSTLAKDGYVLLASDEKWPTGSTAGNAASAGAIYKIASIESGTQFKLSEGSIFAQTTNPTVKKINMVDSPKIKNLNILSGGVGSGHNGLRFSYCNDIEALDVNTDGAEDVGIGLWYTYKSNIIGGNSARSTSSATLGNTGYGVLAGPASRNTFVNFRTLEECRHGISGGGLYPAIIAKISMNHAEKCGIGVLAYDCHEDCTWWEFDRNVSIGSADYFGGFNIRGSHVKVNRNTIVASGSSAVSVKVFEDVPGGQTNIEVTGNDILDCAQGVIFEGSANGRIKNSKIAGNNLERVKGSPILLFRSDDIAIDENLVEGTITGGSSDGDIRLVGDITNFCTDISIGNNNRLLNSDLSGIRASFTAGLKISGTQIQGVAENGMELDDCSGVMVSGGKIEAKLLNFGHGIIAQRCEGLEVSGVEFVGDLANTLSHGMLTIDCNLVGASANQFSGFQRPVFATGTTDRIRAFGNSTGDCALPIDISAAAITYEVGNI